MAPTARNRRLSSIRIQDSQEDSDPRDANGLRRAPRPPQEEEEASLASLVSDSVPPSLYDKPMADYSLKLAQDPARTPKREAKQAAKDSAIYISVLVFLAMVLVSIAWWLSS